ncbi:Methionyl-tRNA formyltransferase [Zea mays]|uniref:methionyl-tRNA formyltransferase n=1 Tax=Zea mays TaxID=4577 RepID=A0A1D6NF91_MAIZE|nr:Methionyl-tRNA formyltransferase [Zea mays]
MARYSPPSLRCFFRCAASSASRAVGSGTRKKNLVFLGSPQVAASVLDKLLGASGSPESAFQVAAVVTQPPAAKNRGRKLMPSAVAQLALDRGFPEELIFTPERAREESFLSALKEVEPDVCITAAYGNILPQKFLDIPSCGTVNIHPSLLPLYRGAAPVQRALQDGVAETGVSLAYTVRALDAGYELSLCICTLREAPELLSMLFHLGSKLLINELPSILDGSAKDKAQPQDDSKATLAPKVRAFAGWPGTRAKLQLINQNSVPDVLEIKVISTKVSTSCVKVGDENEILFSGSSLLIPCSGSTWLEVLELQLPGKKVTKAQDFWNGLRGQKLMKLP